MTSEEIKWTFWHNVSLRLEAERDEARAEVERLKAVAEGISKWRHDIVYPTADGPRRFHMHVRWEDCPDPECVASRAALMGEGPQGG